MSSYPGGLDTFTRRVDNQDAILAEDVNELQEAVENVEAELGVDPAGSYDDVADRLDGIQDEIDNLSFTAYDTDVNLSAGNVGNHSTLEEHVKDVDIHGSVDSLAYNFPRMMDRTLDQLLRGVLSSGFPLNSADTSTTSSFPLDEGDVVFCHTTANPSTSGYDWCMVTASGSSLASGTDLRLNNEDAYPQFADGSRITKLEPAVSYEYDESVVGIGSGDMVFAHPVANPSTSSYEWFMTTADASTSSEVRLDDEGSAPTFADDSLFSVFNPTYTALVTDTEMPIADGDVVFCHPTANPASGEYGWHMVTASSSGGVSDGDLRLDGEGGAPAYDAGSRFSKFVVTETAAYDDTKMPIRDGDLSYCYPTSYPTESGYGWHMVSAGSMGVSSSGLRLDGEDVAPVYDSGSRFSRLSSESYQGVALGGEILELVYVPDWVVLTSVGAGTDPGAVGAYPAVYGNISTKLPLPVNYDDSDFFGRVLELGAGGDPLTSSAFRPRVNAYSGHQDGYYPEAGMYVELKESSSANRGVRGMGVTNRTRFGDLCGDYPVIKLYAPKLSASRKWICLMPVVGRVLDNNDNSRVDVGDYVVVMLVAAGESDSPYITTEADDNAAVDIFNVPSVVPYTGTGEDGALVIDGTYASNSSTGYACPGGELDVPDNLSYEIIAGSGFSSGSSYYYRVTALDPYGNETSATDQLQVDVDADNSDIKLTWYPVTGNNGYRVYGRSNGDTDFMEEVSTEEYVDDNTDTPNPSIPHPTTNSTDGSYRIDTVKNFTNVTVQNGGSISCTPWSYACWRFGKIAFYATGQVTVDGSSEITASGKGYAGGAPKYQGESYSGPGIESTAANAGGGGGSGIWNAGGGGYGTQGGSADYGEAGETYGTPTLDVLYRGSGGGGGGASGERAGGKGGGIVDISADTIAVQGDGSIAADGEDGTYSTGTALDGGGSGGSIYLKARVLSVGNGKVTAVGGSQTLYPGYGYGGDGRIRFDYVMEGPSESNPAAYRHRL